MRASADARLQPEHLFHAVEPGRLADQPARRPHRALGVDRSVGGAVRQFEPLPNTGEDHLVVADRVAAAQCGKADRARLARSGDAITAALRRRREIDSARRRCGAAER